MIPCMQETSQTLIAGPEDQQKFADLEMKPQLSGYWYNLLLSEILYKYTLIK